MNLLEVTLVPSSGKPSGGWFCAINDGESDLHQRIDVACDDAINYKVLY